MEGGNERGTGSGQDDCHSQGNRRPTDGPTGVCTCMQPLRSRAFRPRQPRTSASMPSFVIWSHQDRFRYSRFRQPSLREQTTTAPCAASCRQCSTQYTTAAWRRHSPGPPQPPRPHREPLPMSPTATLATLVLGLGFLCVSAHMCGCMLCVARS